MKIGMCGMGKLGLPVALAIESRGHEVIGYDIADAPYEQIANRQVPQQEEGIQPLLDVTNITMVRELAGLATADIIFLPVQTPHEPRFEGTTRLPKDRADFDYSYLEQAVRDLSWYTGTLAVISTCLPGTYNKLIKDIPRKGSYVYTPQFIAMGTVLEDYLNPEFNLIGVESEEAADQLERFYTTINNAPNIRTDITTAEGIKVFYNTFITAKTLLANSWMQAAHKLGMDVDTIHRAMALSTRRLLSPRYLRGGGPDSGGCHPRDLIALSWLGEEIDMKPNWFEMMAQARELQTEWSADLIEEEYKKTGLPIYIMGKAFKPETNLTAGSGATLLSNILRERGLDIVQYDPHIDTETPEFEKGIYFIATEHKHFSGWQYPNGSIIIDLWRSIEPPKGCLYIPVGAPNAIQDNRSPA